MVLASLVLWPWISLSCGLGFPCLVVLGRSREAVGIFQGRLVGPMETIQRNPREFLIDRVAMNFSGDNRGEPGRDVIPTASRGKGRRGRVR